MTIKESLMRNIMKQASVRWADGSYDHTRTCILCGRATCKDPVYKDFYKEIITTKSYWNWLEQNNLKEDSNEIISEGV